MFFKKELKESRNTIITLTNSKSQQFDYGEIYRQIRTNIEFSNISNKTKVINITSSRPGEGKTTTAVNLAVVYATIYDKVLLIDCDFRKPQIHKYFKISNSEGLSNLLLDYTKTGVFSHDYFKQIKHSSFKDRLTVLPTGEKVPNPTELLSSQVFKDFLEKQKEEYDFIIIDCPPIGAVSDAIPIGNVVDGTIFICSSLLTPGKEAKNAIQVLKKNHCNLLGCVLTQMDTNHNNHYGYYHY